MKAVTTIMKLFIVTFIFAAVFGQPVIDLVHRELPPSNAIHNLPIAGQSFPIAGQEESPTEVAIQLRAQKICEVGELVRLDASESTVDGLKWQILPKTKDFEVIEDGRRAFFSSRMPGEYLVVIAGAKGGEAYLMHHTIRVKGEIPLPGPKTLGVKINEWLDLVPDSETKVAKAQAMAHVFRQTANKPDVDVDNLLEATAIANVGVLGPQLDDWKPFLTELGEELDTFITNGQLETREQFQDVWAKIADGLEQAVQ